jgi:hypothetical protein
MKQAIRTAPKAMARPAARENRARLPSRPFIFRGPLGRVVAAFLVLDAAALFLSPKPAEAQSVQLPAASPPANTDVQTAESAATRQQQEPDERARVTALTRDLAAARREIDAHNTLAAALTRDVAAARQALREERERVAALTRELAAARREIRARAGTAATSAIQTHTGVAETPADDATAAAQEAEAAAIRQRQAQEQERERQASEAATLRQRQALEAEPQRADALAGELAAARQATAATPGPASPPGMQTTHVDTKATPTDATNKDKGALDRPISLEAQVPVEAKKLLTRADLFLRQGDISAARVVLERAIEIGSTEAGYRLAETYDPLVLSSWRTLGTRGDPAKARELYARAYADGIQQAKDRMNALH